MSKANTLNFNTPVSLMEAFKAIVTLGTKRTIYVQGQPGIGKSTLHTMLKNHFGDTHDHIYLDWSLVDYGDLALRAPNRDTGELELYISSLLKPKSPKPKIIMIDELDKGDTLLQKLATRLMLDHVVADYELPAGSIVFATGNLATDGVGKSILAHASNRVTTLNLRNPTVPEWIAWATEANIPAEIRVFVQLTPSCLASYVDGMDFEDNPHIFFPTLRTKQFCSPRSLAGCGPIVESRHVLGKSLTMANLAGTIGVASAKLMDAVLSLGDEITSVADVIKDPMNVKMPDKQAALLMMMFNALDTIQTQDDFSKFMQFMNRVPSSEIQSVFFTQAMAHKRIAPIASRNDEIKKWLADGNYQLLT